MQQLECPTPDLKGVQVNRPNDQDEIDPRKITATTLIGDKVKNTSGEEIGKIEDIVMDLTGGTVSYVVISFGGFAGIGDKFFAVPLEALTFDTKAKNLTIKVDKKTLKKSPGFDKNNWPMKADWPVVRP